MSTPPPYRPPTARHDDGEESLPSYTEAQRRASLVSQPPEYTPAQPSTNASRAVYTVPTPPPYQPPIARHTEGEQPPPAYTEAQRRASLQSQPPEYEPAQPRTNANPTMYNMPTQPFASTSTYRECRANFDPSSSSMPLPNNSRKSTWQKLKEENEARKAKTQHVTHAQAAAMLGHDAEWERERKGWATSRERLEYFQRLNRDTSDIYIDFKYAARALGVEEGWLRREWERERREERDREEQSGRGRDVGAREEASRREWHDEEWVKRRHTGYDDRACVVM